jgi:heat shock protein HspQ
MAVKEHRHPELVKGMASQLESMPDNFPREEGAAPLAHIVEEDRDAVIAAYQKASENMVPSYVDVRVRNVKTGKIIDATMIISPITATSNHVFTVQFISRK